MVPTWINQNLNVAVANDERQLCLQAVEELRTGGFLAKDVTGFSDNFLTTTRGGRHTRFRVTLDSDGKSHVEEMSE